MHIQHAAVVLTEGVSLFCVYVIFPLASVFLGVVFSLLLPGDPDTQKKKQKAHLRSLNVV